MSIKVLVADDHEVVRHGLASLLADRTSRSWRSQERRRGGQDGRKHKPDVVLLDIRMPQFRWARGAGTIRRELPETKVVMLSTYDNPTYVARAVALGRQRLRAEGLDRAGIDLGDHAAAAEGQSPSRIGELRRVSIAMAHASRAGDDDDVPADQPRDAGAAAHGAGSEQQGNRPLAGDQRRDGQGTRAEHPAQDRRRPTARKPPSGPCARDWSRSTVTEAQRACGPAASGDAPARAILARGWARS